ncbi:MAG: SsrA-binding protein SmpB [candidate division SR1 bacterium]|nr:SsrA-binding protein SmpB [candidate division SR1 bacterium]
MKLISKNRHAYHDYQIDKDYEVGIILKGHEVKSIKGSHVNIKDSIIRLSNKELWIMNMDVPLYEKTSHVLVPGYESKGKRKILITKKELAKISSALDKSGTVIIPLEIYINKRGLIKLKIGVGKVLKKIEKKQILKEKDIKKQMDRDIKHL